MLTCTVPAGRCSDLSWIHWLRVCEVVRFLRWRAWSDDVVVMTYGNDPSAFVACSCATLSNELHSHKSWPDLLSLAVIASNVDMSTSAGWFHVTSVCSVFMETNIKLCSVCNQEVFAGSLTNDEIIKIVDIVFTNLLSLLSNNRTRPEVHINAASTIAASLCRSLVLKAILVLPVINWAARQRLRLSVKVWLLISVLLWLAQSHRSWASTIMAGESLTEGLGRGLRGKGMLG